MPLRILISSYNKKNNLFIMCLKPMENQRRCMVLVCIALHVRRVRFEFSLDFVLSLLHRELPTSSCFRFVLTSRRLDSD